MRNIFRAMVDTRKEENSNDDERKEMNCPDDDFVFQQQRLMFRRLPIYIFFFSFFSSLGFFFRYFFSTIFLSHMSSLPPQQIRKRTRQHIDDHFSPQNQTASDLMKEQKKIERKRRICFVYSKEKSLKCN